MLAELLSQVTVGFILLLVVFVPACIGRRRLRATRKAWRSRVRQCTPVAIAVIAVLLVNRIVRQHLVDISWAIDLNLTPVFYVIEGETIVWFQSFASPAFTRYFSLVYIYGYVFLLIFPVIAYFALSDTRPLRELLSAYAINYLLGLILYMLVIAYGPRNVMPAMIETSLFDFRPQYQYLAREVNHNTNVFPSLHTSLSVTIALFAYRTRRVYPIWFVVAVLLAVSIAISTMYLGIHWAIDVAAGTVLAFFSVFAAERLVGHDSLATKLNLEPNEYVARLRTAIEALVDSDTQADEGDGSGNYEAETTALSETNTGSIEPSTDATSPTDAASRSTGSDDDGTERD